MRNTKKARLAIYKEALHLLIDYPISRNGLCACIHEAVLKLYYPFCAESLLYFNVGNDLGRNGKCAIFKELAPYKPKKYSAYWFPLNTLGYNKRVTILKCIIKQLEKELNKKL